eukprot:scaffold200982_cov32-Tisochrysis_lutea.AAC.4
MGADRRNGQGIFHHGWVILLEPDILPDGRPVLDIAVFFSPERVGESIVVLSCSGSEVTYRDVAAVDSAPLLSSTVPSRNCGPPKLSCESYRVEFGLSSHLPFFYVLVQ